MKSKEQKYYQSFLCNLIVLFVLPIFLGFKWPFFSFGSSQSSFSKA
jgi:hypothetical protein